MARPTIHPGYTPLGALWALLCTLLLACGGAGQTGPAQPPPLPAPIITRLQATPANLTAGEPCQILAEFAHGSGTLEPGALAVSSGSPVTVTPQATTTYTLTVRNAEGASASRDVTVDVFPAPRIEAFLADPPAVTDGQTVTLIAHFTGGSGIIDPGVGGVQSGIPVTVRPSGPVTYTLTVTNPLGATLRQELALTVLPPPLISTFAATPAFIQDGQSTQLTAIFANGTGMLEPGHDPVQSGEPVTVSPQATTIYTLSVTNPLGMTLTRAVTVTVDGTPAITSFTAAPPAITFGESAWITAIFRGGTGVLDHGVGTVSSGVPVRVSPTATNKFTLNVVNAAGTRATAELTITVAQAPLIQGFTAQPAVISSGQSAQLTAHFAHGEGRIDPGIGPVSTGQTVTVTPAATTVYTLTVTNSLGATTTRAITVTVAPPPTITSLIATPSAITQGQACTLTAVFQNGTGTLDQGIGAVASGVPKSVNPATTTTYTLTVVNAAGATVTRTVTVSVIAAPVLETFTATPAAISVGESSTLAFTFTQGTGTIDQGIGPVVSGGTVIVTPAVDTMYTLTVTNALGFSVSRSVTVGVLGSPSIVSFEAAPTLVTLGDSAQLTGVFANGTGVVDQGVGLLTSGTPRRVTPAVSTDYTLTVTNALGLSVTRSASVTVVPPPVISIFSASAISVTAGNSVELTLAFSGGTGVIDQGVGAVLDGSIIRVTPLVSTTYTLTVTNAAGTQSSRSLTIAVVPAPVITSFTANASTISAGSTTQITAIFSEGSGNIDPGIGPAVSNVPLTVNPMFTTTYTLTVANAMGDTVRQSLTITVEPPPRIDAFTAAPEGVIQGVSTNLTPVFAYGIGVIDQGIGVVSSGVSIAVTPLSNTTYTLTVTNPAGTSVSRSLSVAVTPFGLSLIAGNVTGEGYTDGTGSAARFRSVTGVVVDAAGTLFAVDTWNHTIRRITAAGSVSTYAGSPGQEGADDGPAGIARFRNPVGLSLDGGGNLFVADTGNHIIRRIDPLGNVTTLAGSAGVSGSADGLGGAARFNLPEGIVLGGGGTLFVTDTGNHTVRKIDAAGDVSTLAGSPGVPGSTDGTGALARFQEPAGLALDASGNLFVADRGNHTLRRIDSGGATTTLAGSPGLAGTTNALGTAARFNRPDGLVRSATGEIYIADSGNHAIRWYATTSAVSTLAGLAGDPGNIDGSKELARFRGPRGLAISAAGNIFIADSANHTLRKLVPGAVVSTLAGSPPVIGTSNGTGVFAHFNGPRGLAADPSGNLLVADAGNHALRKVTPFAVTTTLAGLPGTAGTQDGAGTAARFDGLSDVCLDSEGNAYVADTLNHVIRKVSSGGVATTLAGSAGLPGSTDADGADARFNAPRGIAVDPAGTVYVADTGNHTIRVVTAAGHVSTLAGAAGLAGSLDGNGPDARFSSPSALAFDPAGNLFVADTGNHTIRRITPAAVVTTFAGTAGAAGTLDAIGTAARFNSPAGLDTDVAGILFVADTGNHTVRRITAAGEVTTIAGTPTLAQVIPGPLPGGLVSPSGIVVHPHGHLVVSTANGLIRIAGF